jgi:hypothetical protein
LGTIALTVVTVGCSDRDPVGITPLPDSPLGAVSTPTSATWVELSPTGSPPNPVFALKPVHYDVLSNRLIAFFSGNPPFNAGSAGNANEVWVLTRANGLGGTPTWIKLQPTGTPPRSNAGETVVYDQLRDRLIVYGGCFANCSPPLADVFVLTRANGLGGTPAWSQVAVPPQPRVQHTSVYDLIFNRMITFGGHLAFFGTDQNDTRVLTNANGVGASTWTTLATVGGPPGPRQGHVAIYDPLTARMIVHGGLRVFVTGYDDLWILTNANGRQGTPTWSQQVLSGPVPSERNAHAAVYDRLKNRMILFGGTTRAGAEAGDPSQRLGDLWLLNRANGVGGTPSWTQLTQLGSPPGPRLATAAFDPLRRRMILLDAGDNSGTISNRVWVLKFPHEGDDD